MPSLHHLPAAISSKRTSHFNLPISLSMLFPSLRTKFTALNTAIDCSIADLAITGAHLVLYHITTLIYRSAHFISTNVGQWTRTAETEVEGCRTSKDPFSDKATSITSHSLPKLPQDSWRPRAQCNIGYRKLVSIDHRLQAFNITARNVHDFNSFLFF